MCRGTIRRGRAGWVAEGVGTATKALAMRVAERRGGWGGDGESGVQKLQVSGGVVRPAKDNNVGTRIMKLALHGNHAVCVCVCVPEGGAGGQWVLMTAAGDGG